MNESFTKQIVLALVYELPEKDHKIYFIDSSSIELGNKFTKRGFSL